MGYISGDIPPMSMAIMAIIVARVLQSLERHSRMNSTPDENLIRTGRQSRVERS
jgi:hypothetical protein